MHLHLEDSDNNNTNFETARKKDQNTEGNIIYSNSAHTNPNYKNVNKMATQNKAHNNRNPMLYGEKAYFKVH